MGDYKDLGNEVGTLVDEKNKMYGNSFGLAGDFLKLLYPDGIKPEQYIDMLSLVRIFDKLCRIANKKNAFNEDPYFDIAGYAILALKNDKELRKASKFKTNSCTVCGKEIKTSDVQVGTGDGRGNKFAHYDCFHNKK